MPRIDLEQADVYGNNDFAENDLFRARLMKRFAGHEWVRVINIDTEPYTWQYMPSQAEDYDFSADGHMKDTHRGPVEAYRLDPGESEVLIGENAYLMIEGLYKRVVSKRIISDNPTMQPGHARSFNWTDGRAQEDAIENIYIGKETPSFGKPSELPAIETPKIEAHKTQPIKVQPPRLRKLTKA